MDFSGLLVEEKGENRCFAQVRLRFLFSGFDVMVDGKYIKSIGATSACVEFGNEKRNGDGRIL